MQTAEHRGSANIVWAIIQVCFIGTIVNPTRSTTDVVIIQIKVGYRDTMRVGDCHNLIVTRPIVKDIVAKLNVSHYTDGGINSTIIDEAAVCYPISIHISIHEVYSKFIKALKVAEKTVIDINIDRSISPEKITGNVKNSLVSCSIEITENAVLELEAFGKPKVK
jgi:hypothetical protein